MISTAGFDDLLPFLIFAVFWWWASRKSGKTEPGEQERPDYPQAEEHGSGPAGTVDPVAVLRQMIFGDLSPAPERAGEPAEPLEPTFSPGGEAGEMLPSAHGGEPGSPFQEVQEGEGAAVEVPAPSGVPHPAFPLSAPRLRRRAASRFAVSRSELARGVILAEILDRPLALRPGGMYRQEP